MLIITHNQFLNADVHVMRLFWYVVHAVVNCAATLHIQSLTVWTEVH